MKLFQILPTTILFDFIFIYKYKISSNKYWNVSEFITISVFEIASINVS